MTQTPVVKPQNFSKDWSWYVVPFGYLLLTIFFTWPLLPNFFTSIPRGIPDGLQDIWNFWWMRTSVVEHFTNPYFTNALFYPYRNANNPLPLFYHTLQPSLSLLGGLISPVLGYAGSYNLLLFIGYIATGSSVYALARYFMPYESRGAAFVAGAFYAFSPFNLSIILIGQERVCWGQWVVLSILFLHKSLVKSPDQPNEKSSLNIALAILFISLTFYTDWYSFMMVGLYAGSLYLYLLVARIISKNKEQVYSWLELTIRVGIAIAATLVLIAPVLVGTFGTKNDPDITIVDPAHDVEAVLNAAPLMGWFINQKIAGGNGGSLYLGYVLLAVAMVGIFALFGKNKLIAPRWAWWWVALVGVTLVLSLGSNLRIFASDDAEQALNSGLPLPYQVFNIIPFLNNGRAPVRFYTLATLGLSLMAGWGIIWLQNRLKQTSFLKLKKAGAALPFLVLVAMMVDVQMLPVPMNSLYYPKILDQIAAEPDNSYGILELPITSHYSRDSRRMFFQAIHHKPITSGYISRRVVQFYDNSDPIGYFFGDTPQTPEAIFQNTPDSEVKLLQLYNIHYVFLYRDEGIFDNATIAKQEARLDTLLGKSARIFDDGQTLVYRVPAANEQVSVMLTNLIGGYFAQKLDNGLVYRWTDKQLNIRLYAKKEVEVQLDFTGWSLAPGNSLQLNLGNESLKDIPLSQSPVPYSISIKLKSGLNTLNFSSALAAALPQDIGLPFKDNRKLAIALGGIQLKILSGTNLP